MVTCFGDLLIGVIYRSEHLLGKNADPNTPSGILDITPLSVAIARADLATIELLSKYRDSVSPEQLLHYAADRKLAKGPNIFSSRMSIFAHAGSHQTPCRGLI